MKTSLVLGIMSGTSLDGVDYALCAVGSRTFRLVSLWRAAFPATLRERLHACARGAASSWELAQTHHDLGRFHARHATRFPASRKPQLVGLHGQTVFHHPARRAPATLQIGEPAYLVESLRVPVVSNFRAADLAAGGQGAPLATAFHLRVFARRGRHVCVQNLGGIGNVTSLDWTHGNTPRVLAFDTGPANVLLDLSARHFSGGRRVCDHDGAWAARGRPNEALLTRWLRHPFFARRPPKSTGREEFGEPFLARVLTETRRQRLSREDVLATLTEFTARSVALNYQRHLPTAPHEVILTGGGARNPVLVSALVRELRRLEPSARVVTSDDVGWPAASIEPAAFALLAWLRQERLPGNLPATTGARRTALLGVVGEA